MVIEWTCGLNTLRLRQKGRHFPDDIFKCIFLNENVWISIKISQKFVLKGPINNIPTLVQGAKPFSEPILVNLLMPIYASLSFNELTQALNGHFFFRLIASCYESVGNIFCEMLTDIHTIFVCEIYFSGYISLHRMSCYKCQIFCDG